METLVEEGKCSAAHDATERAEERILCGRRSPDFELSLLLENEEHVQQVICHLD